MAPVIAWLANVLWPIVWHAIKRFGSWLFVAAIVVIIGMRLFGWKKNIYYTAYHAGYSQALTDHPTNTVSGGGVVNYYGDKSGWIDFKLFRLLRIVVVPAK